MLRSRSLILASIVLGLAPVSAWAAGSPAESARPGGLTPIDWIIVVFYACGTIGVGWYYGRKQETTQEYFTGSGTMNPLLIGISLFASLLSTISYLSLPGEVLGKGPVFLVNFLIYPVIFLLVGFVMIPAYMKQKVTSAYALLEDRLGVSVRLLGAVMFLLVRLVWMSLLIYLTATAITIMIGVDEKWVPLVVTITGIISVIYTSLGGLRAVVITDLMQTILLYGGALLVIGTITYRLGGFSWVPTEWNDSWDTQPIFSFDFSTRLTVVGTLLSVLIWYVATTGGDQLSVQRLMATRDARAGRKAFAIQLSVAALVGITLGIVGFALLGYYQANPDEVPAGMDLKADADKIFPDFIAFHLPPVVSGLVMSGLFAAAMSSIDSGVNSITAVVMTDFLDRFGLQPKTERQHVIYARTLAVTIGTIVVLASSFIKHVPGNITEMTMRTANLLTVPIFCLFFFALFFKRSSPAGVWIGTICGAAASILIAFAENIFGLDYSPVSFQWIGPAALVVNIGVGIAASLLLPAKEKTRRQSPD